MKKPKQTKTGIDITHAPASELRKLGFAPDLVEKIIAARQNIVVLVEGLPPFELSQEEYAGLQEVAKAEGCTVGGVRERRGRV